MQIEGTYNRHKRVGSKRSLDSSGGAAGARGCGGQGEKKKTGTNISKMAHGRRSFLRVVSMGEVLGGWKIERPLSQESG